ncbi:MAG: RHS repeat-associated core domain-containing protein [Candidatus Woesearchaeota archaeon]
MAGETSGNGKDKQGIKQYRWLALSIILATMVFLAARPHITGHVAILPISENTYIFGAGGIAASNDAFVHRDYLGSTRLVTDERGLSHSSAFGVFGETIDPPLDSRYGFSGNEEDISGLQHFGARSYDPVVGRFMQVDPIVDTSSSTYTYALNNPILLSDPTGTFPSLLPIREFILNARDTVSDAWNGAMHPNNEEFASFMSSNPDADVVQLTDVGLKEGWLRPWMNDALAASHGQTTIHGAMGELAEGTAETIVWVATDTAGDLASVSVDVASSDWRSASISMAGLALPFIPAHGLRGAVNTVMDAIPEHGTLFKQARKTMESQDVARSIEDLTRKLGAGNLNPGVGTKVLKDQGNAAVRETVGQVHGGARVLWRQTGPNEISIVGVANKHNQRKVLGLLGIPMK